MQAKIEKMKKDTQYHSASLKYWNREASAKQRKSGLVTGLSRAKSDAYSKALYTLGQGRLQSEEIFKAGAQISRRADQTGVSRSNRYMTGKYKEILNKQRQVESHLNNTFGRNMDTKWQGISRFYQNQVVLNREKLGVKPEYGAPVMMPPRDRAGQNWANIQMALGIASSGAAAFGGGG